MAEPWIKMRAALHENTHVVQIAAELNLDELHVVGILWRLWSWLDSQSVDGALVPVSSAFVDRLARVPGFSKAMRTAKWLSGDDGSLTFTRFEEHNGATAKARALTAQRVEKARTQQNAEAVTVGALQEAPTCNAASVTSALPEKRREDEIQNNTNTGASAGDSADLGLVVDEFPLALQVPMFRAAWDEWLCYRRERRLPAYKPQTRKRQLATLAEWGADAASAAINDSIRNGWSGLFEPKGRSGGEPTQQPNDRKRAGWL